ncbi:HAD-IA family hydrolase [Candidatus Woesearchaeota archaeon]|nr:HAD-IA family hydrolase [Candidatus Woesearchaeota archaeon]
MIKGIIFDLWETLATKNIGISKTLRDHFKIEKTDDFLERYERAIQLKAWKTPEEMAINFLNSFNLPKTTANIRFVEETLQKGIDNATLFEGMDKLLKNLKKKYKLGLLSNTTIFESTVPQALGIEKIFDAKIYSWQLHSLKPSKKNFDEVCKMLGLKASECVFIDDGERNVKAAASYGFKTIRYQNIEQLKKELVTLK